MSDKLEAAAARMRNLVNAGQRGSDFLWAYALGYATAEILASGQEATVSNLIAFLEEKPKLADPGLQELSSGAAIAHLREIQSRNGNLSGGD
ncbi:MAG TPA: hypothetical protein VGN60_08930 [Devosia sp.]|jgi:ABC-type cobalamin transport system permease subunit|nr:hypothetical protein [Devosia sp.]